MATRYPEQQWREWFDEFERSSVTVASFCDSIGVCIQTFYRWRRKLNSTAGTKPDQACIVSTRPFISVSYPIPTIEFELPGKVVARVANDVESIRPLVQVLVEAGAAQ